MDDIIRKVFLGSKLPWIEGLPRAIAMHNDLPGESGFSPHQLLFGRKRLGRGPGLPTEHESEDMVAFMDRMRSIDELVADRLQSAHESRKTTYDKKRLEPHLYRVNDRCWVNKPPAAPKEQPRFHGSCKIVAIEGPATYKVEVGPGSHRLCAADQMR